MSSYRKPSAPLSEIVQAPPTPLVSLDPQNKWLLVMDVTTHPDLSELAEPELRLAGIRIRPQRNSRTRSHPYCGITLASLIDGEHRPVTGLPEKARFGSVFWSPSGRRFVFTAETEEGVELWVGEVDGAKARRILGPELSVVANGRPKWVGDESLLCFLTPEDRGPEPTAPSIPSGPIVQENLGRVAPSRTYQDLLKTPYDEALFDYHFSSQVARVDLDGTVERLGPPAIRWGFDPSPDGRYLLLVTLHRPFSTVVPAGRFPRRIEIWDSKGEFIREIADRPLQEELPITFGSVCPGPRSFQWRNDAPATLCWAEALDGGDAGRPAERRDRVVLLPAPFSNEPVTLAELENRYGGITWGHDELAIVSAWWWETRRIQMLRVRPGPAGKECRDRHEETEILFDRSWEDRYGDPGNPELRRNEFGRLVIYTLVGGEQFFLIGEGASEEGDRPFLDRFDLSTGERERLFRSEAPFYEEPVSMLSTDPMVVLTRRESTDDPPNYCIRDLTKKEVVPITRFPHPSPQLLGVQREQIRYSREDGVKLTGNLYLPEGYDPKKDGPLPVLLWAYPQEYKSAAAAGQIKDSPFRFDRVGWWSPILWVTQGYAVLDDPSMPIVGEGEREPNETFVEQLVGSARAAVEELIRRGVGSRSRFAIGGHSYGAFMTANLLSHCDLFAAGIARSGAYNRTLTPFGFQSEERSLWEATDVYITMSPFLQSHRVQKPLLLLHGDSDSNSGTYPLQSERYYNALKGLGATTRLVLLPLEDHHYVGRESVLHVIWETEQWLERYVKNVEEPPSKNPSGEDVASPDAPPLGSSPDPATP